MQDRKDLVMAGEPWLIEKVLFHLLDSALSLARPGTGLEIVVAAEREKAVLRVAWVPGPAPEYSPFSRQELGFVIAQAAWEQAGGNWMEIRSEQKHGYELRMLISPMAWCAEGTNQRAEAGDR
jgi:hypothetical protein